MPALDLRIGIDVGGTNTDAVLLDRDDRLLGRAKVPTTVDVTGGIRQALTAVLASAAAPVDRISHVMLGTTHATNAVLSRTHLHRVALLRLGAPATRSIPPFTAWPSDLRDAVRAGAEVVSGGTEFDGRELAPLDRDGAARFLESVAGHAEAVAVAGVFSPVNGGQEEAMRQLARDILGDEMPVSISSEVGSIGLIERENATILNAALTGVARDVATALEESLRHHDIDARMYFTQNDGTLMSLDYATRFPVLTIGSGPANSLRGAAFLTGRSDAIVVDIGGTSSDLGVLTAGFPRETTTSSEVGGIRTNFRMPDLLSIAIGGGTVVRGGDDVELGPDSVGYRLTSEGLVFGGSTPTLTDAAVAGGRAEIGSQRPGGEHSALLTAALAEVDRRLADAIDRMKIGRGDAPSVVVVGGGSVIVPETIAGVSEVVRPRNHDVANAIGAAIATVSGRWEEIISDIGGRRQLLDQARRRAEERAVEAGADPATLEIVEQVETPLAYLDRPAVRVVVRAAGPLALN